MKLNIVTDQGRQALHLGRSVYRWYSRGLPKKGMSKHSLQMANLGCRAYKKSFSRRRKVGE